MSALEHLLDTYRHASVTEREKGTYFEELICTYLRNEATYQDLYAKVWTYADWAIEKGFDARDTGIDLVAETRGTGEYHAIQCKFYAKEHRVTKNDIDSFFTASGKSHFSRRIIITTTDNWSEHALDALQDQQPPVNTINLFDLENSQIDWAAYQPKQELVLKPKKSPLPHQACAIADTVTGFETADRGKLIMACGTGKTFTSLKIAEQQAGAGKRVLFLVPSLSLLSQTLTEWTQESLIPLHSFAVCSDSDVGKKRKKEDDVVQTFSHELRFPATTEPSRLALEMGKRHDDEHMSVVFSTYHSIDVISRAQHQHELADFDLIICDEAHRTTGATFTDEDDSAFVKVHDAAYIRATKRLYMTATPRIFGDVAKATAEQDDIALYSMNDETWYGHAFYTLTFSEAVQLGLLVDYKVIVLAIDQHHINQRLQALLTDENNQLKVDDAAKIIGCWKALSKQGSKEDLDGDVEPMRRAVAFCQVIGIPTTAKASHKVSSKHIASMFQRVVEAYQAQETDEPSSPLICEAEHVDGSMNASQKEEKLNWLKAPSPEDTCRILSNVRCLSEGVDVPALDAVLFLTPRHSQIDVVQSVGRVMRNTPDRKKKRGYVILPVVVPFGKEAHEALDDNKTYAVVWQVLQALRSHDDRFDAMINKLELTGPNTSKMEVIAITDSIQRKPSKEAKPGASGVGTFSVGLPARAEVQPEQIALEFEVGTLERAIYDKVVKKCGNRLYWETWAKDIADIALTHISRITAILEKPTNATEIKAFNQFAHELRKDLNGSITDGEVIEMLAQHLITKPVFDALFSDYSFAQHNPISIAMQGVLDVLEKHKLEKESDTLQRFYNSVKVRAEGITNAKGRQKIILDLYDKFFKKAFKKMADRLGIVYTPVEAVDFILHSVNDILKREFNQTLGSDNVHIIDPFTGTGTFITRLMQSGLIDPEDLPKKYAGQIHANEIVLLAYYIAAINIESAYHDIVPGTYQPFEGICLTDTFQMYEKEDLVDRVMVPNSARRKKQKTLDIRVILGNPPYSNGQNSQNENNQNIAYPHLDSRIKETYAARSQSLNAKNLYNTYVLAIRWASDRIGNAGVIGYVSDSSFLEKPTMSGLRQSLVDEFTSIHVLNLRGDIRKNMLSQGRAREGQNIFDNGSMTGIAITLFVKNPKVAEKGQIYYHDIGDDLSYETKLKKLVDFTSIQGISDRQGWLHLTPDVHGDWINQRDDSFSDFIVMGDKKGDGLSLFTNYSNGVVTSRDAWCYSASKTVVAYNVSRLTNFYNQEVTRFEQLYAGADNKTRDAKVEGFINTDATRVSWSRSLKNRLARGRRLTFNDNNIVCCEYRPFVKQWLYFDRSLNEYPSQVPRLFPTADASNLVICVSGTGARSGFSTFITKAIPDFQTVDNGQCFPLYLYEAQGDIDANDTKRADDQQGDMFASSQTHAASSPQYTRQDAITDAGLKHFQDAYPAESISKEDLFYYVYGLLHSPDYRERYADNLSKELPRIPRVKSPADFWTFSRSGRELADLHLNYERQPCYPVTFDGGELLLATLSDADFRVDKMRFLKKGDKSRVSYNAKINLSDVPVEAFDYLVNGKAALDWVMDRQSVTTHKESGIVNDANLWATETVGNARYPLELFQRVITVSLETLRIVKSLPTLEIGANG